MEAAWNGCSLTLDDASLEVVRAGAPPLSIPLGALSGFAVVETGPVHAGRAHATTADAELVVGWRDGGAQRSARVPVPREALQVQLFLARLAQLRPEADLRRLPVDEALLRLGVTRRRRRLPLLVLAVLVVLTGLLVAGVLMR